jgi:hypothetical protein
MEVSTDSSSEHGSDVVVNNAAKAPSRVLKYPSACKECGYTLRNKHAARHHKQRGCFAADRRLASNRRRVEPNNNATALDDQQDGHNGDDIFGDVVADMQRDEGTSERDGFIDVDGHFEEGGQLDEDEAMDEVGRDGSNDIGTIYGEGVEDRIGCSDEEDEGHLPTHLDEGTGEEDVVETDEVSDEDEGSSVADGGSDSDDGYYDYASSGLDTGSGEEESEGRADTTMHGAPPGEGQRIHDAEEGGRWTSARYLRIRDSPLHEGSKLTVAQQCYLLLKYKMDHHITDKAMDELCQFMHTTLLPTPNLSPPSLHFLKKVCEVNSVQSYEKHVCFNDCYRFPDMPPSQYANHPNQACPVCDTPRFIPKRSTDGKRYYIPRKVFWEISVEESIINMFGHPEWCKRRVRARNMDKLDFYESDEARRLDRETGGQVFNEDNSVYELGLDWFQCFHFKTHSVGIMGMRYVLSIIVRLLGHTP